LGRRPGIRQLPRITFGKSISQNLSIDMPASEADHGTGGTRLAWFAHATKLFPGLSFQQGLCSPGAGAALCRHG
jgi:hypothetical protein